MSASLALVRTDAPSGDVVKLSRAVLAKHARTFRLASWLLPAEARDEAAVIYAFCRLVDDTADEATSVNTALAELSVLRDELNGDRPPRPLLRAFLTVCAARDIPLAAAHALIRGVATDLDTVRFQTDRDLLRYCYHVAGTVGLMMCGVIGVKDPRAAAHAIDLGIGMQLTNISRDVAEDARMGRIYLPEARLVEVGVDPTKLLAGKPDRAAIGVVVTDLLQLAETYYESGAAGLHYIPARPRAAIAAASRMYRTIGHKLLRQGCDPMAGRTIVGFSEKLWHGLGATATAFRAERLATDHDPALHTHLDGLPGCATP